MPEETEEQAQLLAAYKANKHPWQYYHAFDRLYDDSGKSRPVAAKLQSAHPARGSEQRAVLGPIGNLERCTGPIDMTAVREKVRRLCTPHHETGNSAGSLPVDDGRKRSLEGARGILCFK